MTENTWSSNLTRENSEKERAEWIQKEKSLTSDLRKAKASSNIQRRNTVSISSNSGHIPNFNKPPLDFSSLKPIPRTTVSQNGYNLSNREGLFLDDSSLFEKSPSKSSSEMSVTNGETLLNSQIELIDTRRKLVDSEKKISSLKRQVKALESNSMIAAQENENIKSESNSLKQIISQQQQLIDSLRDDNESYQTLLQMHAKSGNYKINSIPDSLFDDNDIQENDQETSPFPQQKPSSKKNSVDLTSENNNRDLNHQLTTALDTNLGSELEASFHNTQDSNPSVYELKNELFVAKEENRLLKAEKNKLIDENKATALYINRILSGVFRIQGGLEAVLDKDFDSTKVENNSENTFISQNSNNPQHHTVRSFPRTKDASDSLAFNRSINISPNLYHNSEYASKNPVMIEKSSLNSDHGLPPKPSNMKSVQTHNKSNSINFISNPLVSIFSGVSSIAKSSSSTIASNEEARNDKLFTNKNGDLSSTSNISSSTSNPYKLPSTESSNSKLPEGDPKDNSSEPPPNRQRAQTLHGNSSWWNRISVKLVPDKTYIS
ncbi:hypothetical protein AYI68_g8363 [Smittium mucronatum]|uniref:Uncharacterized protein n=1 Tax=Smittium mucronatum TaxID=133383 RepID=A0A1R0GL41_9FUNG|nr:hypothetical protein AYI68_g8363 [Smittium mucronatum]